MESIKAAALFLTFLVGATHANVIQSQSRDSKWDHGLSATVNDYVDNTITSLIPFMQQNGLDPMSLPEIIEGFEVKPVLVTYSAWVKLHDGHMTGLVNVARSGNQNVHYFAKMLRVRVELQFTDLEFDYKYLVKVMNIGPTGNIYGSLSRFKVITDIIIDFNNDEIHLQQFSLTDIGRLTVRLGGNLLSWLISPLISVFVRVFDTIIMKAVQSIIYNTAQDVLRVVNASIADAIKLIESYN